MKKIIILLLLLQIKICFADEGMWLAQINQSIYQKLIELGLEIDPDLLLNIKDPNCLSRSVVSFNGSCSGVIVSQKGLLMTNYHCCSPQILDKIPNHKEILEKQGYWAANKSEEIPIPNLFVKTLENIEEVTEDIIKGKNDFDVETIIQEYIFERKSECDLYDYQVKPVLGGTRYVMYTYRIYRDIRLVCVPPSLIGRYGGEETNWQWPRFSADFAMFRIYTNVEGEATEYSKANIPFSTSNFLPLGFQAYQENDFSMVLGYPGAGSPYQMSSFIELMAQESYPLRKKLYELKIKTIEENSTIDMSAHNALLRRGLLNKVKMWRELIAENTKEKYVALRFEEEKQISDKVSSNEIRDTIRKLQNKMYKNYEEMEVYSNSYDFYREGFQFIQLYRLVKQVSSILKSTKYNYSILNNEDVFKKLKKLYNKIHIQEDKDFFLGFMRLYKLKLNKEFQIQSFIHNQDQLELWCDDLFQDKVFCSFGNLKQAIQTKPEEIQTSPMFLFVEEVEEFYAKKVWPFLPVISQRVNKLKDEYISVLASNLKEDQVWLGADKNFRFSYGKIKSYSTDEMKAGFRTTYKDLLKYENEKHYLGSEIKNLPILAGINKKTPVCFIANCHTATGNSGSPVINAKGQLIGLNFDRNQQGTISDLYYDINRFRNIVVDIRYIINLLQNSNSNTYLKKELNI